MSNPSDQAPPLAEGDPVNNIVGSPPVLPQGVKEVTPLEQAQAIKHMYMVMIPPIVWMKNLILQGPTAPLDDRHHQGTILEPISIILIYPLTIHQVLATLGRYPNLMVFQVEELNGGVLDGDESRTLDYCEQGITFPSGDATLKSKQMRYKETIKPYTSSRVRSRPKSMTRWMS
jgi:hypothetical protein